MSSVGKTVRPQPALDEIRKLLRQKVLQGYDPERDAESADDHDIDWLLLSQAEFDEVKSAALDERRRSEAQARGASS